MILSVVKALNILTLLSESSQAGLTLVEISDLIGQKIPTTFNLLSTLEEQEFIYRDPQSKRYTLGLRAKSLGQSGNIVITLKELAAPIICELGEAIGETVILTLYRQLQRHTILCYESNELLRVQAHAGVDGNLYQTATGRLLLSQLSTSRLHAFIEHYGLPEKLWADIDSETDLLKALEEIRIARQVSFEPQAGQVRALAVPVTLPQSIPAAIGIYYPSSRHPDSAATNHFLSLMKTASAQISKVCGAMND